MIYRSYKYQIHIVSPLIVLLSIIVITADTYYKLYQYVSFSIVQKDKDW